MKRWLLAVTILGIGAGAYCAFRNSATRSWREAAANQKARVAEDQLAAAARAEYTELVERVRELKQNQYAGGEGSAGNLAALISEGRLAHLSPAESEQLLAELGCNWSSTGDYLVVSKDTLRVVRFNGMKGDRLTDAVCEVLAITPAERTAIDALSQQSAENYRTWAVAHVQRDEPKDDVVAKYSVPSDAAFSRSLTNAFVGGVTAILGRERGELLQDYASDWMTDFGMRGDDSVTLTVKKYQGSDGTHLSYEVRHGGGSMSSDVVPRQPFPEAFRPIFPGGWAELAQREGFELPEGFKK